MEIKNLYVGGWFQRTMLQLSEIYDFVRGEGSKLPLNAKKLDMLREQLDIADIEYNVSGQEYVKITTKENLVIKIFEDGLITLNKCASSVETLMEDINEVTNYYEKKLAAAINYLFSLGAPLPKELAHIENIYPYFVVCENTSRTHIKELLENTEKQKYFEFSCPDYSVVRGDKFYFINDKKSKTEVVERYIEEQIFIREFKEQLHKYLNIHRNIWEKIEYIKAKKSVKGADIVKTTTKLDGYAQTITLIEGRIDQMSTYIDTRASIAKSDSGLKTFLDMSGYGYDTLKNTLEYIKSLWSMTKNHLNSIQRVYSDLHGRVTSKSVKSLTVISTMNACASFIGLLLSKEPVFSWFGIFYFAFIILIGWGSTKLIKKWADKSKYELSENDSDSDITK